MCLLRLQSDVIRICLSGRRERTGACSVWECRKSIRTLVNFRQCRLSCKRLCATNEFHKTSRACLPAFACLIPSLQKKVLLTTYARRKALMSFTSRLILDWEAIWIIPDFFWATEKYFHSTRSIKWTAGSISGILNCWLFRLAKLG